MVSSETGVRDRVRDAVTEKAEAVQEKAGEIGGRLRDATPDDAQQAIGAAAEKARQQPMLIALLGVFVLGLLIGRMRARPKGRS